MSHGYTNQLYLQKSTWLRGSIDQKHAKTNEIWRQNCEIHPAFACPCWPPWFPDLSRPYGACVKRGSGKHMFGLSIFRPSRQSPRRAKKDSNIPSPGRTRSDKCPTPGPTTTIKSPPHPSPPCPAGIILRVHWSSVSLMSAKRCNITGVLYECLQSVSDTRDNSGGSRGGTRGPGLPVYL